MKKAYIIVISIIVVVLIVIVGILFFTKNDKSNTNMSNNSGKSSSSNTSKNNTSGGKQDGGFNLETLVKALKNQGYLKENGEELETGELQADKVVKYGNILLVQYGNNLKKYFEIYDEQKVKYQGKELKLGGAVGPYCIFFLDNNIDHKAVKIFEQAGGYYR